MNVFDHILATTSGFGAGFSFILSIAYLIQREKVRFQPYIVGILLCLGMILACSWAYQVFPEQRTSPFFYFLVPADLLLGPLLVLYFLHITYENFTLKPVGRILITTPPAMVFLLFLLYVLFFREEILFRTDGRISRFELILNVAFTLNMIFYVLIVARLLKFFSSGDLNFAVGILILIVFLSALTISVLTVLSSVLRDYRLVFIAEMIMTFTLIFIYLMNYRYPELSQEYRRFIDRSLLSQLDLNQVRANLEKAMTGEKVHLDPELSLTALAKKISISKNQLSEYLNTAEKLNFKTFVNRYRIEEAKRLLSEETEMPIIRVAFQAGFNSKSSFTQVFRKFTGISAGDYRQQNSPKQG